MNFIEDSLKRMRYYKSLADKTFEQLNENDFYYRPNEESNSIAIIIQHMYGNMMSRFTNFLTEDGEKSWRKRDAEFEPMELGHFSTGEQCDAQDDDREIVVGVVVNRFRVRHRGSSPS